MADISQIDIPGTVTAIMAIVVAIGGIAGRAYVNKALDGISLVADVLVDVGQLMIVISKAGEDGVLTPEEWTCIKEEAREIQAHITAIAGKFGSLLGA
jgi:hypothetical protein